MRSALVVALGVAVVLVVSSGGGGRSSKLFNEIQWVLDFRCDGWCLSGHFGGNNLEQQLLPLIFGRILTLLKHQL